MSKRFLNPINLVNLPSDPTTGSEGDIYYNTALDIARIYVNGVWQNLGAGTTYTDEESVDAVATALDNGTHSNVAVTYDDATNAISLSTTGNVSNIDSIVYPDYITFDTTPETIPTESGSIFWDSGDGLPATVLNSNVTIGLGQEQVALVKNATGASIAKGKVVYISGAQGQRPTITLSDADTEETSSKTFGLTAEAIADGAEGFVTTFGVLRGVNTGGLTQGAPLWLSSTAGGYTTTIPAEPAHSVFIGYVVKAHVSSGEIFVNIQNGYELNELHGVLVNGVAEDQVLRYDDATGLWKNTHPNIITAKNATESTIPAFTPVYINTQEFDQDNITFAPADAATSMYLAKLPADAITTTSVASNSFAKLVTMGVVSGVDLTGYSLGELLYVGVGGGLTSTRPTGTNAIQPFARVLSTDNGTIYVYGNTFASSINTLPNLETDKVWLGTSGRPVETTLSTSVVAEGSNLYFTDERAQDATSSMISSGAHNGISVEYVDASGIFNFTNTGVTSLYGTLNEIEVSALNGDITIGLPSSITISDITFSGDSSNQSTAFLGISSYDTADIAEGTNLYFTDERARAALSADLGGTAGGIRIIAPTSASDATLSNDSATHQVIVGPSGAGTNIKGTMSILASSSISDPGNLGVAGYIDAEGSITGSSIIKDGGTSSEFLKADGSVDSNTYLTSESDTLEDVTDRGATTSNAISITDTTPSSSYTTGALTISGGVGIGENLYVNNNVYIGGDINITGSITGDLTSVDVTNLVVTDPLIYLAEGNPDDSVDIGIFAALEHGAANYNHTGLIRDASDSGKWKLASGMSDPTSNVIDFTSVTYDALKIGSLETVDPVSYLYGGTGLSILGTAGQSLVVNSTEDGLEWADGGSGAGTIVSTTPPASPVEGMGWFDNGTGKLFIYDGTFWVEATNSLNDESVMDIVSTMIGDGTHNNIEITYSDLSNSLSFNVLSEPITDFLTLNETITGTPTGNAGIIVNRGDLSDVAIRFNETEDQWEYTNDGAEYQSIGSGGGAVSTMTALSNSFWLGA